MLKKSLIIIGVSAAAFVMSACGPETLSQRNWGKSYETATYNQMLNPEADKTKKSVGGMDGQAAMNSLQKYRTGFKKEVKQTINLKQ